MTRDMNGHLKMSNSIITDTKQSTSEGETEKQSSEEQNSKDVQEEHGPTVTRERVRRQLLNANGVYVQGMIQGVQVELTADTGAVRTILSGKNVSENPKEQTTTIEKCYWSLLCEWGSS